MIERFLRQGVRRFQSTMAALPSEITSCGAITTLNTHNETIYSMEQQQRNVRRPKCVLAPMVRSGELPTRLLSLKYGADLVWGPETVDKAIIGCVRTPNSQLSCIDYSRPQTNSNRKNHDAADKLIFRIHPPQENAKLIFQLGTASPTLAVEAALTVARDVSGIDVNSGCPKHFSIHSGMGAALLRTPDKLCDILTSLVAAVGPGTEYNLPVSVKIRLLQPYEETFTLVSRLVRTGIKRLTVHLRTTPMRPREAAIHDPAVITGIVKICHEHGVEIFINGDVRDRAHAEELCKKYDLDGCMIARAAEENPSCFLPAEESIRPWREVAVDYLQTAMSVDNNFSNTKFCLAHIVPGKSPLNAPVTRAKTYNEICSVLGVECTVRGVGGASKGEDEEEAKSQAINKAQKGGSKSANAAGGAILEKEKKKKSERGISSSLSPPPTTPLPSTAGIHILGGAKINIPQNTTQPASISA